jgi:hypothetical protein
LTVSRKDFVTPIPKRAGSGYTSCHTLSGGSGLSCPKPQGRLRSFWFTAPTVRMYPIHGIYNTCDVSTLKGICPQFLYAPRLFSFSGSIWRLFAPHDPKCNFSNTLRRLWPRPYYSNRLLATRICVVVMTIMSFPDSLGTTSSGFYLTCLACPFAGLYQLPLMSLYSE